MSIRTWAVALSVVVAIVLVGILAVLDYRGLVAAGPVGGWLGPWAANAASALVGSLVSAILLVNARRFRGGQIIVPCVITLLVFFSMFPVYAVVGWGAGDVYVTVCPRPAEAYAAPLAVLAASVSCGVVKWKRAV